LIFYNIVRSFWSSKRFISTEFGAYEAPTHSFLQHLDLLELQKLFKQFEASPEALF